MKRSIFLINGVRFTAYKIDSVNYRVSHNSLGILRTNNIKSGNCVLAISVQSDSAYAKKFKNKKFYLKFNPDNLFAEVIALNCLHDTK